MAFRNLSIAVHGEPRVVARSGLEIKVCVRTYRFFYVSNTEDVLWRLAEREELKQVNQKLQAKNLARKKWIERLDAGSFQRTLSS
jgi:paired amphipathic helix protein Sin3a